MNDLKTLHEIGAELDSPTALPPDRLRDRVVSAIAEPRQRVRLPRFGWRVATAGGLGLALAAGLIAVQTVGVGDRPPAANAEAAAILQSAAQTAGRQPEMVPRADQFVFTDRKMLLDVTDAGGATLRKDQPGRVLTWLSVDGTATGRSRYQMPNTHGWQETRLPGCRDGRLTWVPDGVDPTKACTPDPGYLGDLPTDADAMLRYLYAHNDGPSTPDTEAFFTAGKLILQNYVPPRSMAAIFNALAKIPGTTVVRDAVDAAGRRGVAVGIKVSNARTEQLIFDRRTFAYLGGRTVAAGGEVTTSEARLRIAIVDKVGQLPQ
jgi:hypothetical protein